MKAKTHTQSLLESWEASQNPKPNVKLVEKTERKAGARRNWRDGSMIGAKFGKLTVVGAGVPHPKYPKRTLVRFRCDCGQERCLLMSEAKSSSSCVDCMTERRKDWVRSSLRTHGRLPKDVFSTWCKMRARCESPGSTSYKWYGGRGIRVCERWYSFEAFLEDMGPRPSPLHSVDRIDNDGDYSPENCRWATPKDQARNRRSSRLLCALGETKSLASWAEESPVNYSTIIRRLSKGWTNEAAIFTPNTRRHST